MLLPVLVIPLVVIVLMIVIVLADYGKKRSAEQAAVTETVETETETMPAETEDASAEEETDTESETEAGNCGGRKRRPIRNGHLYPWRQCSGDPEPDEKVFLQPGPARTRIP